MIKTILSTHLHISAACCVFFWFSGMVFTTRFEPRMILELDSCVIALLCLAIFAKICYAGSFHR